MTTSSSNQASLEQVLPYLDGVAKSLVDRFYGPDGPPQGTTLADIEQLLLLLRQHLTQSFLHLSLQRQAQNLANNTQVSCPLCQDPLLLSLDDQQRLVQTQVGQALWSEPKAYCKRCRRAFFPAEQKPGH